MFSNSAVICIIDSATSTLQMGLHANGSLFQQQYSDSNKHGEVILPLFNTLLESANVNRKDIDYFIWNMGPGSFTGIRLALSVIQAHVLVHPCRLISLSSLQLLAWQAYSLFGLQKMTCLIDARMGQLYMASYVITDGKLVLVEDEKIIGIDSFLQMEFELPIVGVSLSNYSWYSQLVKKIGINSCVDLSSKSTINIMLELAQHEFLQKKIINIEDIKPTYLHNYQTS